MCLKLFRYHKFHQAQQCLREVWISSVTQILLAPRFEYDDNDIEEKLEERFLTKAFVDINFSEFQTCMTKYAQF